MQERDHVSSKEDVINILAEEGLIPDNGAEAGEETAPDNATSLLELDEITDRTDLSDLEYDALVSLYFAGLGEVPLLTREEEVALARRMEQSRKAKELLQADSYEQDKELELEAQVLDGQQAREHLIRANIRLVVSIAKNYRGRGLHFLDLIQNGNIGLMKAADKFDPDRGTKFSTYATWWIRQSIMRSIRNDSRTIRLPVHIQAKMNKIFKTGARLTQMLGRNATPEEIAEEMGLKPDYVRKHLGYALNPRSLNKPIDDHWDGEGSTSLEDFIENPKDDPVRTAEECILEDLVTEILEHLTPREERILRLRFGLGDDYQPHTLEEIARMFDLTRERIRQIEEKALRRLNHPRYRRKIGAFLGES